MRNVESEPVGKSGTEVCPMEYVLSDPVEKSVYALSASLYNVEWRKTGWRAVLLRSCGEN